MARTYGCLPSECLQKADSFDIMVLDVANTYKEYVNAKESGKPLPSKFFNEDNLVNKLKRARGEI